MKMIEELFRDIDFSEIFENLNNFCLGVLEERKLRLMKRKIRFNNKFKYKTYIIYNPVAHSLPIENILFIEKWLLKRLK